MKCLETLFIEHTVIVGNILIANIGRVAHYYINRWHFAYEKISHGNI